MLVLTVVGVDSTVVVVEEVVVEEIELKQTEVKETPIFLSTKL